MLADITARDRDGELIAVPTEWDEEAHGARRKSASAPCARRVPAKSPASATARCCGSRRSGTDGEPSAYTGRVIKIIDRAKPRTLGIFRALPDGGGRLSPIDKKQLGRELAIPAGATGDAQDGDLVAVEIRAAAPRLRPGHGARGRAARLAQERDARSA